MVYGSVGPMDKEEMFERIEEIYNHEIARSKRWLERYIEEARPHDRVEEDGSPVAYQHQFFNESSFMKNIREGLEHLANKERQLEILLRTKNSDMTVDI